MTIGYGSTRFVHYDHETTTFGGNSDAFYQMSEISPNFFNPARNRRYTNVYRNVSQYRLLDKVSQLRRLEEDVANATLWPKALLLRWLPPNVASTTLCLSVAIATFGGSCPSSDALGHSVTIAMYSSKRHNCDTLSKCRYCDTFL